MVGVAVLWHWSDAVPTAIFLPIKSPEITEIALHEPDNGSLITLSWPSGRIHCYGIALGYRAVFKADCTAACSMIGYWHHPVVCLSVCL